MRFFDILSLILSFLGLDGLVLSLRYLVPCYFIPVLSAQLNATQQLLSHAEMVNAIAPPDLESEYKAPLYLYEDLYIYRLSSHTIMQSSKPICGDAYGEQSCPGVLPAIASYYLAWLDLPTLRPLLSNRRNEVEARGKSDHSLSFTQLTHLSWRLMDNSFAPQIVSPERRCCSGLRLALQLVCICHTTYFKDDH